jgi:2'-5' RNA ligase
LPKRLFFALWPAAALQEAMHGLAQRFVGRGDGRVIAAPKLHLTLAFLGSVDAERQACYERAADGVRGERFELRLDQAGSWRRSGIVWLGTARTPEPLQALVRELNSALTLCGYEPERRPFKVHVTLVRAARRPDMRQHFASLDWSVEQFCLVESHMLPSGASYELLRSWPLA